MKDAKTIPPALLINFKIATDRERREGEVTPVGQEELDPTFLKGLTSRRLIRANRARFNDRRRVI